MQALKDTFRSIPLNVSRSFSNEEKSEQSERSNNSDLVDKNGTLREIAAKFFETKISLESSLEPGYVHTALQAIGTLAQARDKPVPPGAIVINGDYIEQALHYSKVALNLLLYVDRAKRQDTFTQLQRLSEEGQRGYHATKTLAYGIELLLQELFDIQQKAYLEHRQELQAVPNLAQALQYIFNKLMKVENEKKMGSKIEPQGLQRATKQQKAYLLLQRLITDPQKKEKAIRLLISCLEEAQKRSNGLRILREILTNDHKDRPLDEPLFKIINSNESAKVRVIQEIMDCYRAELEEAAYPHLDEDGLPEKKKPGTLGASSREDPAQILLFRVIQNGYLQEAGVFNQINSRFDVKKDAVDMARHLAYCVTYQHRKFSPNLLAIYRSIYNSFQIVFDNDYQKWFQETFKQEFFTKSQGRLFVTQQIFLRSINPFILKLYKKANPDESQPGQMTCYRLIQKTLSTTDVNQPTEEDSKSSPVKKKKKEAAPSKEEKERKEREKAERKALEAIRPILRDCSQKVGEYFLSVEVTTP